MRNELIRERAVAFIKIPVYDRVDFQEYVYVIQTGAAAWTAGFCRYNELWDDDRVADAHEGSLVSALEHASQIVASRSF